MLDLLEAMSRGKIYLYWYLLSGAIKDRFKDWWDAHVGRYYRRLSIRFRGLRVGDTVELHFPLRPVETGTIKSIDYSSGWVEVVSKEMWRDSWDKGWRKVPGNVTWLNGPRYTRKTRSVH